MTPSVAPSPLPSSLAAPSCRRHAALRRSLLLLAFGLVGAVWGWPASAQPAGTGGAAANTPGTEQGVRWSELEPAQQAALRPLERQWSGIDARSKQKWQEFSKSRFPSLRPDEQVRVQERMSAWTRLTPRERGEARMNFQQAKQVPPQDRQARWKAYEALSPEQKQQLAARAPLMVEAARSRAGASSGADPTPGRDAAPQLKSNIVSNPAFAASPRAVAPAVVQARPGATTTLITRRPAPPGHQQTGMPKIAATPEFVNRATLLPQRGPQGAATTRSTAAPEPAPPRR